MDSYLDQLQQAIASATQGMTAEELMRRPPGDAEGKWCAAEVLEHLYLTYTGTIKGLERCLRAGKPLADAITFKQRARVALVINLGYLPTGRKAPERSAPKGLPAEKVMSEIASKIATMGELLNQCESRHGAKTRLMNHPILGPLTAQQWRKFHWMHGRHHVRQISSLRAVNTFS